MTAFTIQELQVSLQNNKASLQLVRPDGSCCSVDIHTVSTPARAPSAACKGASLTTSGRVPAINAIFMKTPRRPAAKRRHGETSQNAASPKLTVALFAVHLCDKGRKQSRPHGPSDAFPRYDTDTYAAHQGGRPPEHTFIGTSEDGL